MNIDSELLSKAVDMLKTFAADQVALDPGSRGEYSHRQCVEIIEGLEDKLSDTDLRFDIHIQSLTTPIASYTVEVTENYEDDKYHVVVYEVMKNAPSEHMDTKGLDTAQELFEYLREIRSNLM